MVYNALIESQFSEELRKAEGLIQDRDYPPAQLSLDHAKTLIGSLPFPYSLVDKFEYWKTRAQMSDRLNNVCQSQYQGLKKLEKSDILMENSQLEGMMKNVLCLAKKIGIKEEVPEKRKYTPEDLAKGIGSLAKGIEGYRKEAENEYMNHLREEVIRLMRVTGLNSDEKEDLKSLADLESMLSECASRLEELAR